VVHANPAPFTMHVAHNLGYSLAPWKLPQLPNTASAPAELCRLNTATTGSVMILVHDVCGSVEPLRAFARQLDGPCFGLQMSPATRQQCHTVQELAQFYVEVLKVLELPDDVRLAIAGFGFGCNVAHAMALLLGPRRCTQLILIDGCVGRSVDTAQNVDTMGMLLASTIAPALITGEDPVRGAEDETLAALRQCRFQDERLDLLHQRFKPPGISDPAWDAAVDAVLSSVRLCMRLADEFRPSKPFLGATHCIVPRTHTAFKQWNGRVCAKIRHTTLSYSDNDLLEDPIALAEACNGALQAVQQ